MDFGKAKKKMWYVWVDDERPVPEMDRDRYAVIICRTYAAAIDAIRLLTETNEAFIIDLDHDLGEEKTGYDIAKYIVEHDVHKVNVFVHTMNPVGRHNIVQLMEHYGYTS